MLKIVFTIFLIFYCFTLWESAQNRPFPYLPVLHLLNMGNGGGNVSHIENARVRIPLVAGKIPEASLTRIHAPKACHIQP